MSQARNKVVKQIFILEMGTDSDPSIPIKLVHPKENFANRKDIIELYDVTFTNASSFRLDGSDHLLFDKNRNVGNK